MQILTNYLLYTGKKKEIMKKINIVVAMLLTFLLISACGPEPFDTYTDYTVKNTSSYNVKLTVFDVDFDSVIKNKDTTFLISPGGKINYVSLNWVREPFSGQSDSAYIIFDNNKQITYKQHDEKQRNILDINNYIGGEENDYLYKYEYTITDEDYDNAVDIE